MTEFETDETPDGDTEITLIQVRFQNTMKVIWKFSLPFVDFKHYNINFILKFHEDAILASEGDNSSQSRTLIGRLEDGRIIISETGDDVETVAMVIQAFKPVSKVPSIDKLLEDSINTVHFKKKI